LISLGFWVTPGSMQKINEEEVHLLKDEWVFWETH